MSQPDDTAPTSPAAQGAEASPQEQQPLAGAYASPMLAGSPYRVPEQLPFEAIPAPFARKPWPVIGPALSVFAVLLWAFVVAGQYATSWEIGGPIGQGPAVSLVLLATFASWLASIRLSRVVAPPPGTARLVGRSIGIAALAFVLFLVALFGATLFGSASPRNHDFFIAFALVVLASGAAILGPRLTAPTRPERTRRARVALGVMWLAGALLTLVAGFDLAAHG
jgi:hypothetical protein